MTCAGGHAPFRFLESFQSCSFLTRIKYPCDWVKQRKAFKNTCLSSTDTKRLNVFSNFCSKAASIETFCGFQLLQSALPVENNAFGEVPADVISTSLEHCRTIATLSSCLRDLQPYLTTSHIVLAIELLRSLVSHEQDDHPVTEREDAFVDVLYSGDLANAIESIFSYATVRAQSGQLNLSEFSRFIAATVNLFAIVQEQSSPLLPNYNRSLKTFFESLELYLSNVPDFLLRFDTTFPTLQIQKLSSNNISSFLSEMWSAIDASTIHRLADMSFLDILDALECLSWRRQLVVTQEDASQLVTMANVLFVASAPHLASVEAAEASKLLKLALEFHVPVKSAVSSFLDNQHLYVTPVTLTFNPSPIWLRDFTAATEASLREAPKKTVLELGSLVRRLNWAVDESWWTCIEMILLSELNRQNLNVASAACVTFSLLSSPTGGCQVWLLWREASALALSKPKLLEMHVGLQSLIDLLSAAAEMVKRDGSNTLCLSAADVSTMARLRTAAIDAAYDALVQIFPSPSTRQNIHLLLVQIPQLLRATLLLERLPYPHRLPLLLDLYTCSLVAMSADFVQLKELLHVLQSVIPYMRMLETSWLPDLDVLCANVGYNVLEQYDNTLPITSRKVHRNLLRDIRGEGALATEITEQSIKVIYNEPIQVQLHAEPLEAATIQSQLDLVSANDNDADINESIEDQRISVNASDNDTLERITEDVDKSIADQLVAVNASDIDVAVQKSKASIEDELNSVNASGNDALGQIKEDFGEHTVELEPKSDQSLGIIEHIAADENVLTGVKSKSPEITFQASDEHVSAGGQAVGVSQDRTMDNIREHAPAVSSLKGSQGNKITPADEARKDSRGRSAKRSKGNHSRSKNKKVASGSKLAERRIDDAFQFPPSTLQCTVPEASNGRTVQDGLQIIDAGQQLSAMGEDNKQQAASSMLLEGPRKDSDVKSIETGKQASGLRVDNEVHAVASTEFSERPGDDHGIDNIQAGPQLSGIQGSDELPAGAVSGLPEQLRADSYADNMESRQQMLSLQVDDEHHSGALNGLAEQLGDDSDIDNMELGLQAEGEHHTIASIGSSQGSVNEAGVGNPEAGQQLLGVQEDDGDYAFASPRLSEWSRDDAGIDNINALDELLKEQEDDAHQAIAPSGSPEGSTNNSGSGYLEAGQQFIGMQEAILHQVVAFNGSPKKFTSNFGGDDVETGEQLLDAQEGDEHLAAASSRFSEKLTNDEDKQASYISPTIKLGKYSNIVFGSSEEQSGRSLSSSAYHFVEKSKHTGGGLDSHGAAYISYHELFLDRTSDTGGGHVFQDVHEHRTNPEPSNLDSHMLHSESELYGSSVKPPFADLNSLSTESEAEPSEPISTATQLPPPIPEHPFPPSQELLQLFALLARLPSAHPNSTVLLGQILLLHGDKLSDQQLWEGCRLLKLLQHSPRQQKDDGLNEEAESEADEATGLLHLPGATGPQYSTWQERAAVRFGRYLSSLPPIQRAECLAELGVKMI